MRIGGGTAFVVIDESKFRHKIKPRSWFVNENVISVSISIVVQIQ